MWGEWVGMLVALSGVCDSVVVHHRSVVVRRRPSSSIVGQSSSVVHYCRSWSVVVWSSAVLIGTQ